MSKMIPALLAALLLAACSSTPTTTAPVDERATTANSVPPPPSNTQPVAQISTVSVNPLKDPNNILSKRDVFFDFDSYTVRDEFKPLVTAHANYLSANRSAHLTVQGNADERGTHEYNLALGQRRADAVKKMMTLVGATDSQVDTVSFGKEKPRDSGHDEAAWAQNRRDDIVYRGE